jgi:hypothetical protein
MATSIGLRVLTNAAALVREGWCRGADARAPDGAEVDPWDERAASWSLLGAIVAVLEREARVRGEVPLEELAAALYALADVIEVDSLAEWNDADGRSRDEVLDALAAAERRYEPPWPGDPTPSLN